MTIQQAFELALQHHQVGRFSEAEALYRQILAVRPDHAEALHLLGVIAHQVGRNGDAVNLISQAIARQPGIPSFHSDLGNVLADNDQLEEAVAAYRQAIRLDPNCAEAHNNLGLAQQDKGQLEEAIAAYHQAIALKPDFPEAHSNLGNALREKGQMDAAIAAYRQAITLRPNFSEAHYNLGVALQAGDQLDEAITAFRQALAIKPDLPAAHSNLGNALREKGQVDAAIAAFHQAIALKPDFPEAHSNLGNALREKGQMDAAIAAYRQAITLRPNFSEAHYNLGVALKTSDQLDEAITAFRQALAIKPDYSRAHNNLGNALLDKGRLDEAIAAFRRAIAFEPNLSGAHSNLALALHYHPGCHARSMAEEHDRWQQQHAKPLRQFIRSHANDRDPERRVRVGYVSPDFREHSVAFFVENLLAGHDTGQVEVFCYSNVARPDEVTARLQRLSMHWREVSRRSDVEVAELIRQDQIDILVDLAGHTAGNRLLLFARQPAPIQVTYLGYCDTTGLHAMDYRLTDAYCDPPGTVEHPIAEKLVRLPDVFACFRPAAEAPSVQPRPASAGGPITFASFHMPAKLNAPLLERWARLLQQVPASQLLLSVPKLDDSQPQRLREFLAAKGVDAERLVFTGRLPLAEYLAQHQEVDVLLDSFPFTGHTVSCHALWMGVPVVTLVGQTHCTRMVGSMLHALGLEELIAQTPEQYVQIACDLAGDPARLEQLRSTLRERMRNSPLFDANTFARHLGAAYRAMWRRWCLENKPALP